MADTHSPSCGRSARLVAAMIAAVALLAGCGGSSSSSSSSTSPAPGPSAGGAPSGGKQQTTPGVYVGAVPGTQDAIALVSDGSRLTGAYVCIPSVVGQWITQAPLRNGKAPLVARRGVALGSASFSGGKASGKVSASGSHNYTATLAKGHAGLYRTTSGQANQPGSTETGWIVAPDGTVCGQTDSVTSGGGFKSTPAPKTPEGSGRVTDFADPFPF